MLHWDNHDVATSSEPRAAGTPEKASCHACRFKPECLPAELDGEPLNAFERNVLRQSRPVKAGQVLVRQGEEMHALYALRVGALKAVITTADGTERVIGFRFPGAIIGLAEPEQTQWARTFVALEDAWLCRIPMDAVTEHLRRQLVKLMSHQLRQEYNYHLNLAFKSTAEKVGAFLLELSDTWHRRQLAAQRFTLPMHYTDMASYLGMRHESVCRTLGSLEQQGLVTREGRRIHIPDLQALRAFCAG